MRLRTLFLVVAASLLVGSVLIAYDYWRWSGDPLPITADHVYELPPGTSLNALSASLVAHGYLRRPLYFRVLAEWSGASSRLQAGEYQLQAGMSPQQLLRKLTSGQVIEHQFTIIAGTTVAEVLNALAADERLSAVALPAAPAALADLLDLQTPFVEGVFLPDTYQFRRYDTALSILSRAHQAMLAALELNWQSRTPSASLSNPFELLILASIVEKETGQASDRAQISQVFHLRLAKNMRLQTDPTVIYALGEAFDGDLRRKDLRVDSAYNTYRYHGLPPTPIALPSKAALVAAAHPAEGDFLYFVARGDGSSEFSRTLDAHNSAVRRYQLGQRSQ